MHEIEFEMECPGSVTPDEKYGQLWPNKRVFFFCEDTDDRVKLMRMKKNQPILPIRKP